MRVHHLNCISSCPLGGGIAVKKDQGWLLLAGDAYFDHDEMHPTQPRCAPGLRFYQWMMEKDRRQRFANQDRLRVLCREHVHDVHVVCSHDPRELERDAGHKLDTPVLTAPAGLISSTYPAR